jgi:peptide/nickel transport system substrate-binding protein
MRGTSRLSNGVIHVSGWMCVLLLCSSVAWGQGGQSGRELTIALSSLSTETLDPALGGHIVKYYMSLIFDYLVGTTPDGKLSPESGIATKWEMTPDQNGWVFELRQGVKFHNGDELTAEDVKASLLRGISQISTTGYAGALRSSLKEIEVVNPHTLIIHTKAPSIIIPHYLSRALSTEGVIMPKALADEKMKDQVARHPIGSGPYRFVEQVTGSHIKLEAVHNHWRIGTPRFQTVTFRLVPEESARIAMLRRGEVDIIDLSRERVAEVKRAGFDTVLRQDEAMLNVWLIQNWEPNVPVHDKRVREAMNIAINRPELLATLFDGMGEVVPIPYGLSWTLKEIGYQISGEDHYPYDPERAKKLLAEAGYANGFTIDFHSFLLPGLPEGRAFVEAVAGYWEKIGIRSRLIPVDYAAFRKKWVDKQIPGAPGYYNIANRSWVGTYALLEKQAYGPSVMTTVKDPQSDAWIQEILTATDESRAFELMRHIFQRFRGEHYVVPLFTIHSPYAVSKKVAGWNIGTIMYDFNLDELARAP